MLKGQCHCGAVQYEMPENVLHHALCHCTDCRRHAGAPMVAWAMVAVDHLRVEGEVKIYHSSEHGRRHFCPECGTGLFYRNEAVMPGAVDVQTATLNDPDALPAQSQIQVADRIEWMRTAHLLPEFERFPPG